MIDNDISVEASTSSVSRWGTPKQSSKEIPHWLWSILAKSLGIKLYPGDRPYLASFLHLSTICSAGVMVMMNLWFCGYDIASDRSETDILDGIVRVCMTLQFTGVGIYAHRLSYRLFSHPKFMDLMRLHSKTVLKVNSAVVLLLINIVFVLAQNISDSDFIWAHSVTRNSTEPTQVNPCENINIPLAICHSYFISQCLFSVFFLAWNVLVSLVLVSVSRTHTVSLRQFLYELEVDAHLLDIQFRQEYYTKDSPDSQDTLKKYFWSHTDDMVSMMKDVDDGVVTGEPESIGPTPFVIEESIESRDSNATEPKFIFTENNIQTARRRPGKNLNPVNNNRISISGDSGSTSGICEPRCLSEQEILHKYFKIATQVRLTSLAFQRWMIWIVIVVGFWSAIRVVYWLSHQPDILEVILFCLPLISMPILASSYGEVNYEGFKVVQSIMPTPERVRMLRYLKTLPIEMTMYGHRISYGTMGTVLFGIFAAFASKIVLQELNKVIR